MKTAPKKFNEKEHIDKVGIDRFDAAVGRQMMRLSSDNKLLGAPKIRRELAYQMALLATGAPRRPFTWGGRLTGEMQSICDDWLNSVEVENADC